MGWPEIAQSVSAILVTVFSALLVVAVLGRVKPVHDWLGARIIEIERRLAEAKRDRRPIGSERVKDGETVSPIEPPGRREASPDDRLRSTPATPRE
jgi:hypothetical protein